MVAHRGRAGATRQAAHPTRCRRSRFPAAARRNARMSERATNAERRRQTLTNRYVLAVLVAVLLLAYLLRYALLPLAAAAVVAYAVSPVIVLLNRRVHLPRLAAVLV